MTQETIDNLTLFNKILDTNIDVSRHIELKKMYADYGNRLTDAPASSKEHFHNAFPGGYIEHVLHVYDNSLRITATLKDAGGIADFTKAELTMAALHHDLWKSGMPNGEPYYEVETSEWHQKRGSIYKHNEKLPYFKVPDGSLFVLQQYNIKVTYNEWMGIKLSDGLYDETNKAYLMNNGKFSLHTNLAYIIHWADHMSSVVERELFKQEFLQSN